MQNMNLQALEIFRTVAMEGSVSRAANRLGRVQSNISTRIKQLEEVVGKSLFRRQNRGLTLTADGKLLLDYAERFHLLSVETSEALGAGQPSGRFSIGAMESTAAARLPAILSRYHAQYPDVEVVLKTDTAGGLLNRLYKYEIDIALLAEPVTDATFQTLPVFEEELVLVTPASYPPLDDFSILNGRSLIAFEAGCAYRRYLERWQLENGIAPGTILSVSSYLAILSCVSAGTGYAVVPKSVLDMINIGDGLRPYPLSGSYAAIKTLLVWRAEYHSAKLDALLPLFTRDETPNS